MSICILQHVNSCPDPLAVDGQVCKKSVQQRLPPMGKLSSASDPTKDPEATRQVDYKTDYRREDDERTEIPAEEKTRAFKV